MIDPKGTCLAQASSLMHSKATYPCERKAWVSMRQPVQDLTSLTQIQYSSPRYACYGSYIQRASPTSNTSLWLKILRFSKHIPTEIRKPILFLPIAEHYAFERFLCILSSANFLKYHQVQWLPLFYFFPKVTTTPYPTSSLSFQCR